MLDKTMTLNSLTKGYLCEHSNEIAIQDGDAKLSYKELMYAVDAMSHELLAAGIVKADPVVIFAERALCVFVSTSAVLKIGAFYVPVNLGTPLARLAFICKDVQARAILVDDSGRVECRELKDLDKVGITVSLEQKAPMLEYEKIEPDDIAYIIYTSGTTGTPKGVIIEHGSIASKFFDWDEVYGLRNNPYSLLQVSSLGFDMFTGDWVKMICSGGRLVICPYEDLLDPKKLYQLLVSERINFIDVVPSVVRVLTDYVEQHGFNLSSLSVLSCGADAWTKDEYLRFKSILKVPRLINGYGLTECSVENTIFEDSDGILANKSVLPIGKALASDTILLVDDELNPVAVNTRGEICIGGPCVARGYVNRPELDAEKFFTRPDEAGNSIRYYRTGDIGLIEDDANINFYGRSDHQVKLNGYRIELHEIESLLQKHKEIRKAVAFIDYVLSTLIVAVQCKNEFEINEQSVIASLAAKLPKYMVPSNIITIPEIPITVNGKVDREAVISSCASVLAKSSNNIVISSINSLSQLIAFFECEGVNARSLIAEFVKFNVKAGVAVMDIGDNGLQAVDDTIRFRVLVKNEQALKPRKDNLMGCEVKYRRSSDNSCMTIDTSLQNINIKLELVFTEKNHSDLTYKTKLLRKSERHIFDVTEPVVDGWTIFGEPVVKAWYENL